MLDRTTPPAFKAIEGLHFPWPQTLQIKRGIPLYLLNMGQQPIIRLELVFEAGKWQEPQNGVAYLTAKMLLEGTKLKDAAAVARYIDQYGASLSTKVYSDTLSITLITLSKHLTPMLELLAEILFTPAFDEQRLVHRKHLKKQSLKLAAEKSSQVAKKKLKEVLFKASHPYGRQLTEAALEAVTLDQIKQYYYKKLLANTQVFLSGQVRDQDVQAVQQHLQALPTRVHEHPRVALDVPEPIQAHLPAKGQLQAALNVGRVLIAKKHPDYLPMLFVSTLLGGYFGSRLMRNIREEKGYTYGIYARIIPLRHMSYLQIATEVIQAALQATYQEIAREIQILQTTPVPQEELQTLRNYLFGTFLTHINDPFSIMEKFKQAQLHGLGQDYYTQLHHTIRDIDTAQIMELANKYLVLERFSQVTVA
ncbi:MAG: pitrilysin family protein [Bacteroidota bacterium]